MDNWIIWETVARQREDERRQISDQMRQARLARTTPHCPGRSQLAALLATMGVKLDADAARTAVSRKGPAAGARRAA
jgi:hypothetical protein